MCYLKPPHSTGGVLQRFLFQITFYKTNNLSKPFSATAYSISNPAGEEDSGGWHFMYDVSYFLSGMDDSLPTANVYPGIFRFPT